MHIQWITLIYIPLLIISCGHEPDFSGEKPPISNAPQIIEALSKYKLDNGVYPVTLDQLIPDYLGRIPSPHWGANEWEYLHFLHEDFYTLYILRKRGHYEGYYYSSDKNRWAYDQ